MTRADVRKLLLVVTLVLIAHAIDLACTWVASPDLAGELNVSQSLFGLGWIGLVGVKLIGVALAAAGYAYYLRHRDECYPKPGAERSEFCRWFASGKPLSWIEMQYRRPHNRNLAVHLGYFWAGMQMFVLWAALDNWLLTRGIACGLRAYSEIGYHLLQAGILAALVLARFYSTNYRRYTTLNATPHAVSSIA